MKKDLLTVKELAAELRMSVKSIQRGYRKGDIPVQWMCRMARFDLAKVQRAESPTGTGEESESDAMDCNVRLARQAGGARRRLVGLVCGAESEKRANGGTSETWGDGLSGLSRLFGLSCWPDRKTNQKNQRDQRNQTDEIDQRNQVHKRDRPEP
jgi:hypothetical protein